MQRFEFKSAKAGTFALRDGLNGPRDANELFPNLRGAADTAPRNWRFTTCSSSKIKCAIGQPFDIQGATECAHAVS